MKNKIKLWITAWWKATRSRSLTRSHFTSPKLQGLRVDRGPDCQLSMLIQRVPVVFSLCGLQQGLEQAVGVFHHSQSNPEWKSESEWACLCRSEGSPEPGSWKGALTSPDGGCKGRCRSWMRRPQWPASGAAPQKSPEPEGTAATAARRSPAGAGRTGIPVGCGRGSRPNERSAAGTGVPPGEAHIQKCPFQGFIGMQAMQKPHRKWRFLCGSGCEAIP